MSGEINSNRGNERILSSFRKHALRFGVIGFATLGVLGMSSESRANAQRSNNISGSACVQNDPNTLSISQADGALKPLDREVFDTYKHAEKSQKVIKHNQPEMFGLTFNHLTEVDIIEPAKVANGANGEYVLTAQFLGKITSEDMIAVEVTTYQLESVGSRQIENLVYDFYQAKTDGTFVSPNQGMQQRMQHEYKGYSNNGYDGLVISKLADGSELPGFNSMTSTILQDGLNQADNVLKDMNGHRAITPQKNLNNTTSAVMIC